MTRKAAITWVLIVPIAILNGFVRRAVLEPAVGDFRAHQISVATATVAFLALIYAMLHGDVAREDDRRLLGIGVAWVGATVIFEFAFGRYVTGASWGELLKDYNMPAGRLWPVVLVVLLISPLLVKRWVTRHPGAPLETGRA